MESMNFCQSCAMSMEEMIVSCIQTVVKHTPNMTEADAKEIMEKFSTSLKRWK